MNREKATTLKWIAPICVGLLAGCSADVVSGEGNSNDELVASEGEALSLTNQVFSLEHHIRVAPGVELHVLATVEAAPAPATAAPPATAPRVIPLAW
jgi:hypothetical protein